MAKKQQRRPSPLDEPPTASSSSDEEEQTPSQPKEDEVEEDQSSSEEEEEDESEEEEDHPPVLSQSATKNPPPPPTKTQPKPTSSSESESGTDSDSEEEDAPPPPNPKVKPPASKPMDPNPNSKTKAQVAQSSPAPNKSGTKRATENNNAQANDSKRAKKKSTDTAVPAASAGGSDDEMETEEDGKKSGEESKKTSQRVWSEEDEITIVKSMADFISRTGNDPVKYIVVFYEEVKKSLSFEATSTQLKQKIRRIRDKYNAAVQRMKKGVDPTSSKPHDQKLYDLSKKVWGKDSNEVEEKVKSNGKTPKSPKKEASTKNTASAKKPAPTKKPVHEAIEEPDLPVQVVASKESAKDESDDEVALSEMFRFDKGMGLTGLSDAVVNRGLKYMDESKKAALVEKWKKQRADEFQLFVNRTALIEEQARLLFESYQSSNP